MKTIPLGRVSLGTRQRRHIDKEKIGELASSIAEKGLFHPIVCVETSDGLKLVAGERRWRAIRLLHAQSRAFLHDGTPVPLDEIPYILVHHDLDEIQIREAELEENIIRVDLTWQDKVAALDELHELRLARNPKQSVADTAREISSASPDQRGSSMKQAETDIYRARIVAGHLDDPEVANATNLTQAFSIVSKHLEAELTLELTKRGEQYISNHTLIHGDFTDEEFRIQLPSDFTCIIADPPYGIGADSFGNAAQHAHTYQDSMEAAIELAKAVFTTGLSCTLAEAHLYLFCDVDLFTLLRDEASLAGWNVWRTPLIWNKTSSSSHAPILNRGFKRSYELILFAVKGDKPFSQVFRDVVDAASPRTKDVAAQKPVELYATLLGRSCLPGDKVLDPCCGPGTIFTAAEEHHLEAWGVEKDQGAYEIANLTLSLLEGGERE